MDKQEQGTKRKQPADPYAERKKLTFEQAEGAEPLPTQLKLKEVSPALRAALWAVVLRSIDDAIHGDDWTRYYVGEPWHDILKENHIFRQHRMADEFTDEPRHVREELKTIFVSGDYVQIFGFLQFVIRHRRCPAGFAKLVEGSLKFAHAAYHVVEQTICPIGSEAERG